MEYLCQFTSLLLVAVCCGSVRTQQDERFYFYAIFAWQRKETARRALTRQPQPLQIKYNCNEQDVPVTITRCKRSPIAFFSPFCSFFFQRRYLFFYHFPWSIQPFHLVEQNRDRQQQKDTNEAQTALRMFHYNNDERKKKKKSQTHFKTRSAVGSGISFFSSSIFCFGDEYDEAKKKKAFEAT